MMLMRWSPQNAGRRRGGDGDPPLLLLGHPVHRGRALVDLADLVDLLRVEEDPLGDGGLARVDMGDDPDVPRLRERNLTCHDVLRSWRACGYHLKWLKALLASAILWVSSRRLTAAPRPFDRVDELGGELLAHALAAALAGRLDEPAHAERQAPIAADLDRDLVGRATDAARLDLDDRGRVAEGRLEDLEPRPARLRLGPGEGLAQDPVGQVALAVVHQLGGEAGGRAVGRDRSRTWSCARWSDDGASSAAPDRRRGLRAVLAAALLAVADAGRVERAADDVVLDRRAGP